MPASSSGDIVRFLGPWPTKEDLDAEVINAEDLGSYERETVRYSVSSSERVTAFVNVPKRKDAPLPAVFCHHQHASTFDLDKSEVVGLAGDPDQAYAHELAQQGFITIAPDAIGFEDRNWSRDRRSNVTWFPLKRGELDVDRVVPPPADSGVPSAVDRLYRGRTRTAARSRNATVTGAANLPGAACAW